MVAAAPTVTPAQRIILESVRFVAADGWPVTVREVRDASGYRSLQTVWRTLGELVELGLIAKHPRNPAGGWMPVPPA